MNTLILKLNATGDVVRTTPILWRLHGHVTWITASNNTPMIGGIRDTIRCLPWEERAGALDRAYDLVINLEDDVETASFAAQSQHEQLFGAYVDQSGRVNYTDDACKWFDMSLISSYGRARADALKLANRRSYQELIFEGLGWSFNGDRYLLPVPIETSLRGDVALAPVAGPVWPMKNWAHYDQLRIALERRGLVVNTLPRRASLREHLGDVANHRLLVSGDSLPMHLAIGLAVPCVTIFTCTSPWEIFDYGVQRKVVSPLLERFFYRRGIDLEATSAVSVDDVVAAIDAALVGENRGERRAEVGVSR